MRITLVGSRHFGVTTLDMLRNAASKSSGSWWPMPTTGWPRRPAPPVSR